MFTSRSSDLVSAWCTGPTCASPANECRDLNEDINNAKALFEEHPDKVHLIRFEDLSVNPELTVKQILSFLDLPWSQRIDQFISSHTVEESVTSSGQARRRSDPYGTSRNSSAVAFAWKHSLPWSNITALQSLCSQPMKTLGYRIMENQSDLKLYPLVKTADETWPLDQ